MTISEILKIWLILLYVVNIGIFIALAYRFRRTEKSLAKKKGSVPTPGGIISWGIPLFFLITRVGEIHESWWLFVFISLVLSIYHVVMHAGALWVMGRFYVPGSGILSDHRLLTSGPFHYVRHPIFSAFIALWLAAGIGTMNWILLALWPAYTTLMVLVPIRQEEELLSEKFGEEYASYKKTTGKILPKL